MRGKIQLTIIVDVKPAIKAIKVLKEDVFISLFDFDELESQLNCLGITTKEDDV